MGCRLRLSCRSAVRSRAQMALDAWAAGSGIHQLAIEVLTHPSQLQLSLPSVSFFRGSAESLVASLFAEGWDFRGTMLVLGLAAYLCWAQPKYFLLFALVEWLLRLLLTHGTPCDGNRNMPPAMANGSSWCQKQHLRLGFEKPIEIWERTMRGRQDFVEIVLTRILGERCTCNWYIGRFWRRQVLVLHLIQSSIETEGKAIAVPFRTWLPGSEDTFLESLFGTATAAIRRQYFLPSWNPFLRSTDELS